MVGNRPQFIKSAPLSLALRARGIEEAVVHTGQHYDPELSQIFFEELGLAEPRHRLDPHLRPRCDGARDRRGRPRGAARLGARLRRHELDARRRPRRRRPVDPARPRRGGTPQRRPDDARGAQPHRDRPPRPAAALPRRAIAPNARRRRRCRTPRSRRRRDVRRQPALRAARPRALRAAASAAHLRRGDHPPRGERPPTPARAHRRRAQPARRAGRLPGSSHEPEPCSTTSPSPRTSS